MEVIPKSLTGFARIAGVRLIPMGIVQRKTAVPTIMEIDLIFHREIYTDVRVLLN